MIFFFFFFSSKWWYCAISRHIADCYVRCVLFQVSVGINDFATWSQKSQENSKLRSVNNRVWPRNRSCINGTSTPQGKQVFSVESRHQGCHRGQGVKRVNGAGGPKGSRVPVDGDQHKSIFQVSHLHHRKKMGMLWVTGVCGSKRKTQNVSVQCHTLPDVSGMNQWPIWKPTQAP